MDADHHHFNEEPGKSGSQQQAPANSQAQGSSLKKKGAFQITSVRDHKPEEHFDEPDLPRTELNSEAIPQRTPSGDASAASSSAYANGDSVNYSELSVDNHAVSGIQHADNAEGANEFVETSTLSPTIVSSAVPPVAIVPSTVAAILTAIAPSSVAVPQTANLLAMSNVVEENGEAERNAGEAQASNSSKQSRFRVVKVGSNPPAAVTVQAASISNPHLSTIGNQPYANVANKKMSVPVGPTQNAYQVGRWNVVDTNEGDMQHGSTMPYSHVEREREGGLTPLGAVPVQQQPSQPSGQFAAPQAVTSPTSFPQTSISSSVPVLAPPTSTSASVSVAASAAPPVSVVPPVSAAASMPPTATTSGQAPKTALQPNVGLQTANAAPQQQQAYVQPVGQPQPNLAGLPPSTLIMSPPQTAPGIHSTQQYANPTPQFAQQPQQLLVGGASVGLGSGGVKYQVPQAQGAQPQPVPGPVPQRAVGAQPKQPLAIGTALQAQVQPSGPNVLLSGMQAPVPISAVNVPGGMQSAPMSVPVQPVQPMLAGSMSQQTAQPSPQQPMLQPQPQPQPQLQQAQAPSGPAKPVLQTQPGVNVPNQTLVQNTQPPPHPTNLQATLPPPQPQYVSTPQQPTANQFINVTQQYSASPGYVNVSQVQSQLPSGQRPPQSATTQPLPQAQPQPQPQPQPQSQTQPPATNPINSSQNANVDMANTLSAGQTATSFENRIDKAFEEFKRQLMTMVNDELVELHNEISDLRETRYQLDHENVVLRRHATQETLKMVDQIRREHNALMHAASASAGSLSTSTGYVNAPSSSHNLHIG